MKLNRRTLYLLLAVGVVLYLFVVFNRSQSPGGPSVAPASELGQN